jgi:hypothetical protein
MTDPRDPLSAQFGAALDQPAVKTYVPSPLAALGLTARTCHGISGSGGPPGGGNGGGSAPRSLASAARKGGRDQGHH